MSRRLRMFTAALRRAQAGSVLIVATLVAMAAVSLFSWWQLTRAAEARRRASDDAIGEYAAYSARMFAEGAYRAFEVIRLRALMSVISAAAGGERPVPSLTSFSADVHEALERAGIRARTGGVGTFVATPVKGEWRGTGAAADAQLGERILRAMRASTRSVFGFVPVHFVVINEPPLTVAFVPVAQRDADSAYYGFTVDRTIWWSTIGDDVTRHLPLLPATFVNASWRFLTDAQRLDTLIAISVRDGAGREHYASRPPFPGGQVGEFNALNGPAAIRVAASLHPGVESLLRHETRQAAMVGLTLRVPGRDGQVRVIPPTSLLPALSLVLVFVAAAQLWRQRSVARARRDFVAAVSHELRTPLAQMRLYTETLQLGRSDDESERRQWLAIIAREARKLGGIVDNILAFAHLDAGRTRLEREATDAGNLVEEVVEGYVPLAAGHRMRLVADAPSRIMANVDPRALRQIVGNLIDNAIKYGPPGQTISVDVEQVDQLLRIRVTDQGPGIAADRE